MPVTRRKSVKNRKSSDCCRPSVVADLLAMRCSKRTVILIGKWNSTGAKDIHLEWVAERRRPGIKFPCRFEMLVPFVLDRLTGSTRVERPKEGDADLIGIRNDGRVSV